MLGVPLLLASLTVLCAGLCLRGLPAVLGYLRRRPPAALAALAALVVGAALVRASIEPHHVMYLDEPWHLEAARRWLATGRPELCSFTFAGTRCQPYPKSLGMPALLVPFFALFGARSAVAFAVSDALGIAAVPLAAWVSRRLGATPVGALLPATIVATSSLHAAFCATAETNVAGATFALLALGLAVGPEGARASFDLTLAALAAVLASALRAEAWLLFLALPVLAFRRVPDLRARTWTVAAVVLGACVGAYLAVPTVTLNREISHGAFLAPRHLVANVRSVFRPADDPGLVPVLALLVAVGGAAARRVGRLVPLAAVAFVGLGVTFVVLAYARFQPRMAILPMVLLAPLAGLAPAWLGERTLSDLRVARASRRLGRVRLGSLATACLALFLVVRSAPAREAARQVPASQLLEARLPSLVASTQLPPRSLILSEWPTVLAARSDVDVLRMAEALAGRAPSLEQLAATRPLYLLCDMYCEPGYAGGGASCPSLLERVTLAPVAETRFNELTFGLFRVVDVAPAGAPARAGGACRFRAGAHGR